MVVLVEASILSIGLDEKFRTMGRTPVRMVNCQTGKEAARSLKNEKIDGVVCSWNLPDMPDGMFVKRLKAFKSDIPVIVIVEHDNAAQEIAARALGVSAVLSSLTDRKTLRRTLFGILHLKPSSSEDIYAVEKK